MLLPHWLGGNACDLHSAEGESSSSKGEMQNSSSFSTSCLLACTIRHVWCRHLCATLHAAATLPKLQRNCNSLKRVSS